MSRPVVFLSSKKRVRGSTIAFCLAAVMALTMFCSHATGQLPDGEAGQARNLRDFLGLGPPPDTAAAKFGEPLYRDNCATCHGETARGAQGPNLVRSPVILHDEKGEAIGEVVRKGRPAGGMPAFPTFSETQLYQVAEYLHLQVELAADRSTYRTTYNNLHNQVSGNPEQGLAFFKSSCSGCHSVTGDLARIGARYPQAPAMLARFAWPVSSGPKKVTVVTGDGETVSGTVVKLDDFDVALRDSNGVYRSWPRSVVKVEVPDRLGGHRALLPKYTDADLHDLTAYLVTLK